MNNTKKPKFNQNGSIVVEAALIVPLIILSLVAIIYIALLLYSHAHMQTTANWAVERGASTWSNKSKDFETGKIEIEDLNANSLYWRLVDNSAREKIDGIIDHTQKKAEANNLLAGSEEQVTAAIKDYIIYKKLVVNTQDRRALPLGNILGIFGMSKYYTISAQAQASVYDSAEFVRNIDYILFLEKQLEETYPAAGNTGKKIREILDGIKDIIDRCFK
jgi:hypothetical protein